MQLEARKLLWDARNAAQLAREFVQEQSFEEYRVDALRRAAVERQLEIVGEALGRLAKLDPALAASVPELSRIVGLRNVLIHGYAQVDDRLVWSVLDSKVPRLLADLEALLAEE